MDNGIKSGDRARPPKVVREKTPRRRRVLLTAIWSLDADGRIWLELRGAHGTRRICCSASIGPSCGHPVQCAAKKIRAQLGFGDLSTSSGFNLHRPLSSDFRSVLFAACQPVQPLVNQSLRDFKRLSKRLLGCGPQIFFERHAANNSTAILCVNSCAALIITSTANKLPI